LQTCYFCGIEFENLKKTNECAYCRQSYCDSHSDTLKHDCPLIQIQNPYEILSQSPTEEVELEDDLKGDSYSEEIQSENNEFIDYENPKFDIDMHKNIIEKIVAEKAKNPKLISQINKEITQKTDSNDGDGLVNNLEEEGTEEDEGTDIDTDLPGVYDVEAEFKEPDGFVRPIQIIKFDSPYVKKVKSVQNKATECYFCGENLSENKNAKFIRVRNVEESFFKGLGRELKFKFFGSNKSNDGFYLCEKPDCVTKWKMKEPVYIQYKSGNIQKYIYEN
jgi:hypothetical protein